MNPDPSTPREEHYAALLAAHDEALAAGQASPALEQDVAGAVRSRLEEDVACLQLLDRLRPRAADSCGTSPGRAATPQPGSTVEGRLDTRLGKYHLIGTLGRGGMGIVYRAEDPLLQRQVALKLLPKSVSSNPDALQRFLLEARAAARLSHPNVVTVYEVDEREGTYYIVMELVRGGSVQDALANQGPLGWIEATRAVADVCRGLAAAHAAGLLHRDIKPANIMRTGDGAVKLADFGLAKLTDRTGPGLTASGTVVGTPNFMSPEQCRCQHLDERSDIYSLGATYYTLLTGQPPYEKESAAGIVEIMFAHCSNPPPDPRAENSTVPQACAAIVQRAMAKDPGQRFGGAAEMLAALEAVLVSPLPRYSGGEGRSPAETKSQPRLARSPASAGTRLRRRLGIAIVAGLALLLGTWVYSRFIGNHVPGAASPSAREGQTGPFGGRITTAGLTLPMGAPAGPVAFSPDGRWFAAARTEGKGGVQVWDWASGEPHTDLWPGQAIASLAFSADGKILAAAGAAGSVGPIKLWHADNGSLPDLAVRQGLGRAVAFSPVGAKLAAAIELDNQVAIQVWDRNGKPLTRSLPAHPRGLAALAFSPDGQLLASGGSDKIVKIWDADNGQPRKELKVAYGVRSLAFSRLDDKLVVDMDKDIDVWHCGSWLREIPEEPSDMGPASWNSVAISRDGVLAAHGSWSEEVLIFNIRTREVFNFRVGHGGNVWGVAFSSDGKFLATGSADGTVKLWNASRFRQTTGID